MALSSSELKNGVVYKEGSSTFLVLRYEHIKRGRQPAVYKVKVKDLISGAITEKSYKDADKFESADVERKSAQFLYSDSDKAYFMFSDDYIQFDLLLNDLEWESNFLIEGMKVITTLLEGEPISIELPKTVSLKVTKSTAAVSGNTATGATKEVEVESGFKLQVPLFIKGNDQIDINTDRGEYVGKSKV